MGLSVRAVLDAGIAAMSQKATRSFSSIVDELVLNKELRAASGDLRQRTADGFRQHAAKMSTYFGDRKIGEISADDIRRYIGQVGAGAHVRKDYVLRLAEIFKYAIARNYVAVSPLTALTTSDRKELCGHIESKEPAILTPDQALTLLQTARAHPELGHLGTVVLGLFGGIRSAELSKLEWSAVHLEGEKPFVTISAGIAKKRRIRNVELCPAALTWLVGPHEGLVAGPADSFKYRFRKLTAAAGIVWKSNAMRHSFGSFHYALHGDAVATSRQLGHPQGDDQLFSHYRALANREDAVKYFANVT
jgi:integrase